MTFHDRGADWYLAQLKPNSAAIAERNLKRQGFRTFLPTHEETHKRNGKFVTRMQPLFPGYIFVALDMDKGGWRAVNSTVGITRLVSFGKAPTPVPMGVISQLIMRCDDQGKLLPEDAFEAGELVQLTSGPFANFVAEIEGVAADQRIWVLMDIMGGQTRVAVGAESLSRLT